MFKNKINRFDITYFSAIKITDFIYTSIFLIFQISTEITKNKTVCVGVSVGSWENCKLEILRKSYKIKY